MLVLTDVDDSEEEKNNKFYKINFVNEYKRANIDNGYNTEE